jgi:alpha-1,3/alpha-1,6-mannosyltransferase
MASPPQPPVVKRRVVFIHPDLGLGGAERLVVDSAVGLQQRGWDVTIFTAHHEPQRSFRETRDGTLKVITKGDFLPRAILGKFRLLCVAIRMIYLALYILLASKIRFDVVFCDQLSLVVPILKLSGRPVLFYCHFPDLLLTDRTTFWKKLYRKPLDWLEEYTTGCADSVIVNSNYTLSVFRNTFKSLGKVPVEVLNPAIDLSKFGATNASPREVKTVEDPVDVKELDKSTIVFLSINRFERKKNIQLAVRAFAVLKADVPQLPTKLILAGGYDLREAENVEYDLELRALCSEKKLSISDFPNFSGDVVFFRSFKDEEKVWLLSRCRCVLYTPSNEHFGIVPVEAMFSSKPVVAPASGGPLESIIHKETGFLCPEDDDIPRHFADAMRMLAENSDFADRMGRAGRNRVIERFSLEGYSRTLDAMLSSLIK